MARLRLTLGGRSGGPLTHSSYTTPWDTTDRATCAILGCHVVGERAVEIVQVVAVAIAAGMRVDDLARVPLSFPTYASMPGRAAYRAAQQLNLETGGHVSTPA